MIDKLVGFFALVVLIGFLGILIAWVPEADLMIVMIGVLVIAGYDYYRSTFSRGSGDK